MDSHRRRSPISKRNGGHVGADTVKGTFRRSLRTCLDANTSSLYADYMKTFIGPDSNRADEVDRSIGGEAARARRAGRAGADGEPLSELPFLSTTSTTSWSELKAHGGPQGAAISEPKKSDFKLNLKCEPICSCDSSHSEQQDANNYGDIYKEVEVAKELMYILTRTVSTALKRMNETTALRTAIVESPPIQSACSPKSVSRPSKVSLYGGESRDIEDASAVHTKSKPKEFDAQDTAIIIRVTNHPTTKSRRLTYRNSSLSVTRTDNSKKQSGDDVRERIISLLGLEEPPTSDDTSKSNRLDCTRIMEIDRESDENNIIAVSAIDIDEKSDDFATSRILQNYAANVDKSDSIPVSYNNLYHEMSSALCYVVKESPKLHSSKAAVCKTATRVFKVPKKNQCVVNKPSEHDTFIAVDPPNAHKDDCRNTSPNVRSSASDATKFRRQKIPKDPLIVSRPLSPVLIRCNVSPVKIVTIAPRKLSGDVSTSSSAEFRRNFPDNPHRYSRLPKMITAPKVCKPLQYSCAVVDAEHTSNLIKVHDYFSSESTRRTYAQRTIEKLTNGGSKYGNWLKIPTPKLMNALIGNIEYGAVVELQRAWNHLARVAIVGKPVRVVMELNSGVGRFRWESDDILLWRSLCSQKASLPCIPVQKLTMKRICSWNMLGTGDYCPMSKSGLSCLIPDRSLVQLSLDRGSKALEYSELL